MYKVKILIDGMDSHAETVAFSSLDQLDSIIQTYVDEGFKGSYSMYLVSTRSNGDYAWNHISSTSFGR